LPIVRGEPVSIAGPSGPIEAVVEDPAVATPGMATPGVTTPAHYAVICHPHPVYGGTMDNKVVTTVARALHECSIPTVRFNFRGVGQSRGVFDQGIGETADAAAVVSYAAARWAGRALVVAGFSFGGYVGLRLAQQTAADKLIAIAPAVQYFEPGTGAPRCPWTIIQGDADDVVDPEAVIGWASVLSPTPSVVMLPGVGHFFHGRLRELRDAVIDAIRNG
jgi:alpha/beta superfamily hydrolase